MNGRRRRSTLLAAAALGIAAFGFAPAQAAAGFVRCDIVATVTLTTVENLLAVDGGAGNLSGNFVCTGLTAAGVVISGVAVNSSGSFRFCGHRGATVHTSQCVAPQDQADAEAWADAMPAQAPIVTHVQSDLVTIPLNTITCTHGINGHTLLTHAHLELPNFKCMQGATTVFTAGPGQARAEAASQIIVNPLLSCPSGPADPIKACFNTLTFVGTLVAYSTA